jgi:crotonobetainyl-CoA:carnitine CoA-transferase CaiB-like acyl-CoA transferase
MPGPLEGIRVLDLTRVLAGPFCTLILSDLGADVIKLEDPRSPDYTRTIPPYAGELSHYFLAVNRGKRSVALDLKSEGGRRAGRALALEADVLVENFRPGVLERIGLGNLHDEHPGLVVCSLSGFGQQSRKAAVDVTVQALSGAMSLNGEPDGDPLKLSLPMGDLAGALFGAIGVLAALQGRERSGRGGHVDIALLDSLTSLLSYLAQMYLVTGEPPPRVGNRHHTVPAFGRYAATDGDIVFSAQMDGLWARFCEAAERPDLAADPRFATVPDRQAHFDEVERTVAQVVGERSVAEWEERLERAGVPNGAIATLPDVLEDTRLVRELEQPTAGIVRVLGPVIRFLGGEPDPELRPAPLLGEHTRAILAAAGIDPEPLIESGAALAR